MSQETASRQKYRLEPEALTRLGKLSPQLAWEQVRAAASTVAEQYSRAGADLLKQANLEIDLPGLLEVLGLFNPVRALNLLAYANPHLDLRNLPQQAPLQVLKAVLNLMSCDRYLATGSPLPAKP